MERGADSNAERIKAMRIIHDGFGISTWASIEPIIDLDLSWKMMMQTKDFCDFYKIGLMSGKRNYTPKEVLAFTEDLRMVFPEDRYMLKDSVKSYIAK